MPTIAVVPGDGVGLECIDEALRVLRRVGELEGIQFETVMYPWGADHYLKTGELMPASVLEEYRQMDAILLGAIGDPRVETGLLERAIIGGIRWELDMYINLRPIRLYAEYLTPIKDKKPEDIDMVFVRENTEGLYIGMGGHFKKGTPDEVAIQQMVMTRKGVERVIRYAFEVARKRDRDKKLLLIDKVNALPAQELWTRTFEEVGADYPDIARDHAFIDAACMWMVKNPEWFDVAVTGNMMGDIITDLGAAVQGGLGLAASGNIHPGQVSMFEPIHGSAPKHAGKGVICPIATIAALQMMLQYCGVNGAAARVDGALEEALTSGEIRSLSTSSGMKTSEYTDILISHLES
ncbi:MAG: 3-isopropylmalate dehydrogenase [Candidatus Krumholzibacteriota bacterium]|nr:3-isopropylmalate dehydrogenase [Candidatus Krumholzibacteriota bacterium]